MTADDLNVIQTAIKNGQSIQFQYFPQWNESRTAKISLTGERLIIPHKLIRKNGKFYLFGTFLSGVSLSGTRYTVRLYFQNNIKNVVLKNVSFYKKVYVSEYDTNKMLRNPQIFEG